MPAMSQAVMRISSKWRSTKGEEKTSPVLRVFRLQNVSPAPSYALPCAMRPRSKCLLEYTIRERPYSWMIKPYQWHDYPGWPPTFLLVLLTH